LLIKWRYKLEIKYKTQVPKQQNQKRKSAFTHDVKCLNTVTNILAVRIPREMFHISIN